MKVDASDREYREYQVLRLVGLEQSSRQSSTYNNTCNHKTKITDFCYIVRLSTFNVVSLSYHLSFSIDSAACCFAAIKFRSFFIDILCINFDLPFTIENWFTQDSSIRLFFAPQFFDVQTETSEMWSNDLQTEFLCQLFTWWHNKSNQQ